MRDKPNVDYSFKTFLGYIQSETYKSTVNFAQAMESEEKHEFKKSIVNFLTEFELLNGFEVVTKPPNASIIALRWVCKKKYDCNANLLKYKSRLTPIAHQHKYGIDYGETCSCCMRETA